MNDHKKHAKQSTTGKALRRENLQLKEILDFIPVGVVATDAKGNFTLTNRAARHILGGIAGSAYSPQYGYVLCYPDGSTYPPAELFARALQQGVGAPRSELLVRRPEKNLLVAATCFPLFDGDRLTGAVAILEDSTGNQRQITHQVQLGIDGTRQKQSEEEMQRLEGLHLIGQMAAGISHEIRNPLTTVRGFLQVLSKKDGCSDYKEFFSLMIAEIDRANDIITQFLTMGKRSPSRLERLNLNSIIAAISLLIQADAFSQQKYLKLEPGVIPDLDLNNQEMRQLILNLCKNGLEAMQAGQVLTIKTYLENDRVVLAVHDEGEGIKPEVMEKLGAPFFTTKPKGTGLGLVVCYGIATRHNAVIDVKSEPGNTTFFVRFRLPADFANVPG